MKKKNSNKKATTVTHDQTVAVNVIDMKDAIDALRIAWVSYQFSYGVSVDVRDSSTLREMAGQRAMYSEISSKIDMIDEIFFHAIALNGLSQE